LFHTDLHLFWGIAIPCEIELDETFRDILSRLGHGKKNIAKSPALVDLVALSTALVF
jgi:hypothetical protein